MGHMIAVPTQLTALVTGCLEAIGRAICDELWHQGYRVVGTDRRPHHGFQGDYHVYYLANAAAACQCAYGAHGRAVRNRARGEFPRLASPAAGYLNGSIVDVDVNGGWIC